MVSGTVALPADFQVSRLITLGSGVPFTVFDDSAATVHGALERRAPGGGRLHRLDNWVYRSVDLRLDWEAPTSGR